MATHSLSSGDSRPRSRQPKEEDKEMTNDPPRDALPPNVSYFAGLDVHQKTCDIALVDPEGRVARRWHVKTCPQALDLLARELRAETGDRRVALGLEASTAGKAVFLHLRKLGLELHMAHPRKLESIRSSESKTDRNDAEELARLLQSRHFPESYVPTEEMDELRSWVRVREEQVEKLRRAKTQVRSLLVKHHLQHEASKYSDIFGVQALHWLKDLELPSAADRRQLEILLEEGALLTEQVDRLTKKLARLAVDRKEVELLQSIPGIDYVLALTILAEVADVKRFPNRKKFAAYCGLVPRNRDSGGRVATHASVRHGNPRLKWALDLAVQAHALRIRKGRLFTMFEALKARVGVPKALTAVAHRLAFVIYGVWKSGESYDEGNPDSFARKRERLKERAEAKIEPTTRARSIGKLLSRPGLSGAAG